MLDVRCSMFTPPLLLCAPPRPLRLGGKSPLLPRAIFEERRSRQHQDQRDAEFEDFFDHGRDIRGLSGYANPDVIELSSDPVQRLGYHEKNSHQQYPKGDHAVTAQAMHEASRVAADALDSGVDQEGDDHCPDRLFRDRHHGAHIKLALQDSHRGEFLVVIQLTQHEQNHKQDGVVVFLQIIQAALPRQKPKAQQIAEDRGRFDDPVFLQQQLPRGFAQPWRKGKSAQQCQQQAGHEIGGFRLCFTHRGGMLHTAKPHDKPSYTTT